MSRDLRRQASRHSIEREMAGVHQEEVWRNAQKNLSQTPSSLFLPPLEKQVPRFPTFMPQYGQTLVLTRGGFYKVLIMHMFLPRFPELLSPLASGGLRQDNARRIGVSRQRRHGGPGVLHPDALRQRLLAQQ